MQELERSRCWLEVWTDAIVHNLGLVQSLLQRNTELIAVLKADAYGLGLCPVGRVLWTHGVRHFAVACLAEAFELRKALPRDAWILCMGETLEGGVEEAVRQEIRLTVGSVESAARVAKAAQKLNQTAYIHCKVDTGLHRIGLDPAEAAEQIAGFGRMPCVSAEGVYTHLGLHNRETDMRQHAAMERVLTGLRERGAPVPMAHMLDSIGLARYPAWQYQAVRIGALLYGNASRDYDGIGQAMPPARFVARVARVHWAKAGEYVGYDDEHPLARDTRVATLTAGYADGYPRTQSFVGAVEIRGKRAQNIGLICMDQMMVDVTDIPDAQAGDEAVLLGGGISLREYAAAAHLNRNECTAVIGKRVPRIYL